MRGTLSLVDACIASAKDSIQQPRESRQRLEIDDERELRLEFVDEFVVGGDELAFLLFGKGDIEAIIHADPSLGGNVDGPFGECQGGEQARCRGHRVCPEELRLADRDTSLPFRACESVGQLEREELGSDELMNLLLEIVAETVRLVGVGLCDLPLERHRGIEDVLHDSGSSPRCSRMIWTPMSWTPWVARTSLRAWSARSRTRRTTSGGIGRPAATHSATSRASASGEMSLVPVGVIQCIVLAEAGMSMQPGKSSTGSGLPALHPSPKAWRCQRGAGKMPEKEPAMIELTAEQVQAMEGQKSPLHILNPKTQEVYVLIR